MIGIIVSSMECNLSCRYCYEHGPKRIYGASRTDINDAYAAAQGRIHSFIETVSELAAELGRSAQFILHGGEPLLLSPQNLEDTLVHIRACGDTAVQFQTNGTLVTPDAAELLAAYRAAVVVSLDGPPHLHDTYRIDGGGTGTFRRVMQGIDLLKSKEIPVAALCTVTDVAVGNAGALFDFFRKSSLDFSVNRCFPWRSGGTPGSANEGAYRQFLSELFALYTNAASKDIAIPCFDRCLHDLRPEEGGYSYHPQSSPYISLYNVTADKLWLLTPQSLLRCHDLQVYVREIRIQSHRRPLAEDVHYVGTLTQCVVEHLCEQQQKDYINALKVNQ